MPAACWSAATTLSQLDDDFMVIGMPWIFPDAEAAMAVMNGPVGEHLAGLLSFEAIGLPAGDVFWQRLSAEDQELFRAAALEAVAYQRELAASEEAGGLALTALATGAVLGSMSGSNIATVAALSFLIGPMTARGYPRSERP